MKVDEKTRLFNMTEYERPYWERGILPAGMDEVGRGPLAGPVVTACVIMPPEPLIAYVNDSKKLSEKRREALYPELREHAVAVGLGWVEPEKIDSMNILNATKLAFRQAFEAMGGCSHVLVDAVTGLDIPAEQQAIVHGDGLSYVIAAASVIAKVERDRYMIELHEKYPQYGFIRNKGYGTAEHIAALREYGPCPEHRRSFIGRFIV